MTADHSSERSNRRGASSTGLLLALICTALLIAAAFAWLAPPREPRPLDARSSTGERGASSTVPGTVIHDAPLAEIEQPAPRVSTPADGVPAALGPDRFKGRGRIHGEVVVADGVSFPTSWTLVIEPSPTLIGSEHAVTKRVEFHAGERDFDVGDLPLGGYRLRAEAPKLNCTDLSALLSKGSEIVFATLQFKPSGFLDGRVVTDTGIPADGVDIVLEAVETKLRRTVKSDANGQYVFDSVLDGDYTLCVGVPETPLIPPKDILFRAPSLRAPELTLPPTGAMLVETRAENGSPLAHAEVSGFGTLGGAVRAETDFTGRVRVAWLPPGDYRIEAKAEDGRRGRIKVAVEANAEASAIIHLR